MLWTRPITTEAELRALIPEPNAKVRLKILGKLERHSQHIVALSPLAVLCSSDQDGARVVSVIAGRGRIRPESDGVLRIEDPDGALARAWTTTPRRAGGLFMVPGIDETLRVNGQLSPCPTGSGLLLAVEETFLQCPKAFVRSKLWHPTTWDTTRREPSGSDDATTTLTAPMRTFLERSPFAFLCTAHADGSGDVSPRGDPAGAFVRALDERTVLVPDRTGNHLVDSLRNVISRPRASLVSVIAGQPDVLQLDGRAQLVADPELLAPSAVGGKAPKVGVIIELERARFVRDVLSPVWDASARVDPADFPTMGEMILDQVNPGDSALNGALNKVGSKLFDLGSTFHKRFRLY